MKNKVSGFNSGHKDVVPLTSSLSLHSFSTVPSVCIKKKKKHPSSNDATIFFSMTYLVSSGAESRKIPGKPRMTGYRCKLKLVHAAWLLEPHAKNILDQLFCPIHVQRGQPMVRL